MISLQKTEGNIFLQRTWQWKISFLYEEPQKNGGKWLLPAWPHMFTGEFHPPAMPPASFEKKTATSSSLCNAPTSIFDNVIVFEEYTPDIFFAVNAWRGWKASHGNLRSSRGNSATGGWKWIFFQLSSRVTTSRCQMRLQHFGILCVYSEWQGCLNWM